MAERSTAALHTPRARCDEVAYDDDAGPLGEGRNAPIATASRFERDDECDHAQAPAHGGAPQQRDLDGRATVVTPAPGRAHRATPREPRRRPARRRRARRTRPRRTTARSRRSAPSEAHRTSALRSDGRRSITPRWASVSRPAPKRSRSASAKRPARSASPPRARDRARLGPRPVVAPASSCAPSRRDRARCARTSLTVAHATSAASSAQTSHAPPGIAPSIASNPVAGACGRRRRTGRPARAAACAAAGATTRDGSGARGGSRARARADRRPRAGSPRAGLRDLG